jgi:hypothetical protein
MSYGGHGSFSGIGKGFFSSRNRLDRLWGTPSLLFNGYWRSPPRGTAAGREADRSTPPTAQTANAVLYIHFPICLYAVNRYNFTFLSCSEAQVHMRLHEAPGSLH